MDCFFFFNDTATTEIYTLSLHDALPIFARDGIEEPLRERPLVLGCHGRRRGLRPPVTSMGSVVATRSEEHTSELQSRQYLVCRLLLEKKKKTTLVHNLYILVLTTPLIES